MALPESNEDSTKPTKKPPLESSDSGKLDPADIKIHPHHVSKILDEVLEEPEIPEDVKRSLHPVWLDAAVVLGLLLAAGGFTIGLFKIYITHQAEQCITQHHYSAAIALLKESPLRGLFSIPGTSTDELLNQALYLDAMDKLESSADVKKALSELQSIEPGSKYFTLAQQIMAENFQPSSTSLQGGTSISAPATPLNSN